MGTKLETAETDKAFPTAAQGLLLLGETSNRPSDRQETPPDHLPYARIRTATTADY